MKTLLSFFFLFMDFYLEILFSFYGLFRNFIFSPILFLRSTFQCLTFCLTNFDIFGTYLYKSFCIRDELCAHYQWAHNTYVPSTNPLIAKKFGLVTFYTAVLNTYNKYRSTTGFLMFYYVLKSTDGGCAEQSLIFLFNKRIRNKEPL